MYKPIYLESSQVPATLRGSYAGKQFKAIITETVEVPINAGIWDGGSRETFYWLELSTGRRVPQPHQDLAPWSPNRQSYRGELPEGVTLVCHSMFCGKDMGLTFYLRPENAQKLLTERVELTEHQKIVLKATASLKASYNGRDRYENARPWNATNYPTRAEWESAKAELIASGHLNKAGAITTKGRNAL